VSGATSLAKKGATGLPPRVRLRGDTEVVAISGILYEVTIWSVPDITSAIDDWHTKRAGALSPEPLNRIGWFDGGQHRCDSAYVVSPCSDCHTRTYRTAIPVLRRTA
jgi:hypothetical protein